MVNFGYALLLTLLQWTGASSTPCRYDELSGVQQQRINAVLKREPLRTEREELAELKVRKAEIEKKISELTSELKKIRAESRKDRAANPDHETNFIERARRENIESFEKEKKEQEKELLRVVDFIDAIHLLAEELENSGKLIRNYDVGHSEEGVSAAYTRRTVFRQALTNREIEKILPLSVSSHVYTKLSIDHALSLKKAPPNFPSLFEYRYSILRTLFTGLVEGSKGGHGAWYANDYVLKDGSILFQGSSSQHYLVLRKEDGKIFGGVPDVKIWPPDMRVPWSKLVPYSHNPKTRRELLGNTDE